MKRLVLATVIGALTLSAPAHAMVIHTVQPGETLWSIAAANGFTTRSLAAANGLSEDSQVVLGAPIKIPSVSEAAAALGGGGPVSSSSSSTSSGAPPAGAYTVQPGDTLSAIAGRSGLPMIAVANMNGVDPAQPLLIGTVLKLPTGTQIPASSSVESANPVVPNAAPYPTAERVSSATIGEIAAEHGVPASLASAIGWQESGFNNDLVSSANARGVMQILPGTWSWINSNLASAPLNASSAADNVHAGVLYLGQLLKDTGYNIPETIASYYQGLDSVKSQGILPATQEYVNSVMALRSRFGG
ncbi:MAG TPA: LysM peptidoglycan-binding domain-containing protein [Thermoleophilaceae bacterium]|jgi:LysM repeat protein